MRSRSVVLLLDYDGTLVPLAATPELAAPDRALLELLRSLAAVAEVHLVSGRPRETLERWMGTLPVSLHAEHGFWSRSDGAPWRPLFPIDLEWMELAERAMRRAAARLPGAFVERKTTCLAWHFRRADPAEATAAVEQLRVDLAPLALGGLQLVDGACVLELRDARANKGATARAVAAAAPPGALLVAMGDDTTDEDMFAALPAGALTIHVGEGPSIARERVGNPAAARARLAELVGAGRAHEVVGEH